MDVKSTEKKSKKKDKRLDDDALITTEPKPKKETKKKKSSDDAKTEPDTKTAKPTRIYNKKSQVPEDGFFHVIKGPIYCYF
jgi:hypothetical protein